MSMTHAQTFAFQNAAGFSAQSSSMLWLSVALVLALLWCTWVMWSAYRGWATGSIHFGTFGASAVRVLLTWLLLMFFTLS
jgi:integrating conjugative element protein (TIGR03758 family)